MMLQYDGNWKRVRDIGLGCLAALFVGCGSDLADGPQVGAGDGDGDGEGEPHEPHEPPCESQYPGMICIPEGPFIMGSTDLVHLDELEMPQQVVHMSQFHIDRHEVTFGEYRVCVEAGVCTPPVAEDPQDYKSSGCRWGEDGIDEYPVACIGWLEAVIYCEWRGAALPTEAQWEKAGRGTDGRTYAWGNEAPSCEYARIALDPPYGEWGELPEEWEYSDAWGCGGGGTAPVGSYSPKGDSPYGVQDMAGNVSEFVADWLGPGQADLGTDPAGPGDGVFKMRKGGSYLSSKVSDEQVGWLHLAWRGQGGGPVPGYQLESSTGFRCAISE